jgi:uncharacterized SAM-binding protein YcdF (DUF218 family)
MRNKILIVVVILSSGIFGYLFHRQSQIIRNQPINAWTEDRTGDCAVVLTGGPGRVRDGFDLLAQGRVKKLIISGVFPQAELRDIFPQRPFYGAIAEEDIVLEKRSSTTYGNAQQSLPLVQALQCKDVLLVTSNLHMHRSFKIFRSVFPLEIQVYPRAIVAGRYEPDFFDVAFETIKTLFYSLWAY